MIGKYTCSPTPLNLVNTRIGQMLMDRAERWPTHAVFAHRKKGEGYVSITWQTFLQHIASLTSYLSERGVSRGDRVACYSPNSYHMLVWEMAVTSMGAISVPIFSGYGVQNVDYILQHSEPKAIFVGGAEQLEKVVKCKGRDIVSTLVTDCESTFTNIAECLDRETYGGFIRMLRQTDPSDVCFIQYTSGTTGDPKGVMLTHRNILSQQQALGILWEINQRSRFLSYLPWHHSFGGLFERFTALHKGATIYLEDSYGKDVGRLLQNWRMVKPTQFFSVPKIYIALMTESKLNPEIRDVLFHPELQFVFTAAAPLPKECGEYFKVHNVPVVEGWGLTETSPCVTLTPLGKDRVHSYVGEPIPGCEIMTDHENEILVRGPNVMKDYYKDPERTAQVIDHMGWFHTGDLGEITDYGLRMICRVDGLFKLSNGEKVSSMMVENAVTITSQWIQNVVVLGSGENYVAVLVFPNYRNVEAWARQAGKEWEDPWEMSEDPDVQQLFADEVQKNMEDFSPKYMAVKAFVIIPKELTIDDGDLTPTMKVVRHRVIERYRKWVYAIFKPSEHQEQQKYIVRLGGDVTDSVATGACESLF